MWVWSGHYFPQAWPDMTSKPSVTAYLSPLALAKLKRLAALSHRSVSAQLEHMVAIADEPVAPTFTPPAPAPRGRPPAQSPPLPPPKTPEELERDRKFQESEDAWSAAWDAREAARREAAEQADMQRHAAQMASFRPASVDLGPDLPEADEMLDLIRTLGSNKPTPKPEDSHD